jgi:hypothetical protein
MVLTCGSALLNPKEIQVDQYDQGSLLLLPFARRLHAGPKLGLELRGLKIFMANEVRRIIKQACGAPALTKDSLLFVSLQTNQ